MRHLLYAKSVITREQKELLDKMINTEQMGKLIDILLDSLENEKPLKYKLFLESMEESDDILLQEVAKSLGKRINYIFVTVYFTPLLFMALYSISQTNIKEIFMIMLPQI